MLSENQREGGKFKSTLCVLLEVQINILYVLCLTMKVTSTYWKLITPLEHVMFFKKIVTNSSQRTSPLIQCNLKKCRLSHIVFENYNAVHPHCNKKTIKPCTT